MKVAVFHHLPPGGARRAAFELVRHTSLSAGFSFDYYQVVEGSTGAAGSHAQDIGRYAKTVFPYRANSGTSLPAQLQRARDIRSMITLQRTIAADIDDRGYDVVFVHHDRLTHAPALLRFLKTPSLYYVQEPRRISFEYSLRHRNRPAAGALARTTRLTASAFDLWVQEMDIRGARAATEIAANSYHSAEFIWRVYGRHPTVSYLGIDAAVFTLGTGRRDGLLAVGALDPVKGHDLAIEAVGGLPAPKRPPLTIVYERERPEIQRSLVALAADRGVDLCLRRGINDAELVRLYQSSAATLCTAAVEPFGLTTVESLACGTPVVAWREGGYREVITDGVNGLLADREISGLTAALAGIVFEPGRWNPRDLRSTVLPFFSWEAAAERIVPLFAKAAGPGRRPGPARKRDETGP